MATVFVTFFLITQFHVYEMDADYTKRRRVSEKSLREKRWSMNSQRLEVIVAELMKPISDVRRSFDTDLSALLEEYLTEAGLRALEEGEEGGEGAGGAAAGDAVPNFAELALLLQQSASIYSRKVDFLYQHVLDVSDSLHSSTREPSTGPEGPQTPNRRKRRSSAGAASATSAASGGGAGPAGGGGEFGAIALSASGAARREAPARPPPTLPRGLLELEPRVLTAADAPLFDYCGEPVGLLADFQVAWRLQDGLLVDELQEAASEGGGERARLRAVPLTELQAAIAAAAPPDPPPPAPSPEPEPEPPSPGSHETEPEAEPQPQTEVEPQLQPQVEPQSQPEVEPQSQPEVELQSQPEAEPQPQPLACSSPLAPTKRERKRRSDVRLEEHASVGKMVISAEGRRRLARPLEFALPPQWVARVVAARSERVLAARRRLRADAPPAEFRGFDGTASADIGGFAGWSAAEAARAADAAGLAQRPRADSDDDGFFDQSSTGDSDDSAAALGALSALASPTPAAPLAPLAALAAVDTPVAGEPPEWAAWRDGVVARAAEAAARGFSDVRAAGAGVLRAAAALAERAPRVPCDALLAATAQQPADVSRMFLATLFLANAGQLQLLPGAPLSLNSFSVLLPARAARPPPPAQPPR